MDLDVLANVARFITRKKTLYLLVCAQRATAFADEAQTEFLVRMIALQGVSKEQVAIVQEAGQRFLCSPVFVYRAIVCAVVRPVARRGLYRQVFGILPADSARHFCTNLELGIYSLFLRFAQMADKIRTPQKLLRSVLKNQYVYLLLHDKDDPIFTMSTGYVPAIPDHDHVASFFRWDYEGVMPEDEYKRYLCYYVGFWNHLSPVIKKAVSNNKEHRFDELWTVKTLRDSFLLPGWSKIAILADCRTAACVVDRIFTVFESHAQGFANRLWHAFLGGDIYEESCAAPLLNAIEQYLSIETAGAIQREERILPLKFACK